MSKVIVIGTGGTIASRPDSAGSAVAADKVDGLLSSLGDDFGGDLHVEGHDVATLGSYLLEPADQLCIVSAVADALRDRNVKGVVVTHGTDTMEETAFLTEIYHSDERPVVFTGAQLTADHPEADGPGNLRDAIAVAADPRSRGLGVVIVFARSIFAAPGTSKTQTTDLDAFDNTVGGRLGSVFEGGVVLDYAPDRQPPMPVPTALPRVDIVSVYPGADRSLVDAAVAAGAAGVVIEGTGAGNANRHFLDAATELVGRGIPVVLATRVPNGSISARYGNGGGADLIVAGALSAGALRPSQARILLSAAIASDSVDTAFSTHVLPTKHACATTALAKN